MSSGDRGLLEAHGYDLESFTRFCEAIMSFEPTTVKARASITFLPSPDGFGTNTNIDGGYRAGEGWWCDIGPWSVAQSVVVQEEAYDEGRENPFRDFVVDTLREAGATIIPASEVDAYTTSYRKREEAERLAARSTVRKVFDGIRQMAGMA
jgi:hypothetical protein